MERAHFIRLLWEEDKSSALSESVAELRSTASPTGRVCSVDPGSFSDIPGSPFSYWVSERIHSLFADLPPFEGEGRTVRVGLQTSDDFRFVRAWWEVPAESIVTGTKETTPDEFRQQTFSGKRWVPFAKGGAYSPFYADLYLVIDWANDGAELRSFPASVIRNPDFYFRPGLTWPLRAHRFSPRFLPPGAIFSVRGYGAFTTSGQILELLGIGNSSIFDYLFKLLLGRFDFPEFVVGSLQRLPVFPSASKPIREISKLAAKAFHTQVSLHRFDETNHAFGLPAAVIFPGSTLVERFLASSANIEQDLGRLQVIVGDLDSLVARGYGLSEEEQQLAAQHSAANRSEASEDEDLEEESNDQLDFPAFVQSLMSYAVGVVFGRWDIRVAERTLDTNVDPFAPLPARSPGMLTDQSGAPAHSAPEGYPVQIQWDGILVDDPGHPSDIITRVLDVLNKLLRNVNDVESEVCKALSVRDCRSWFDSRFFAAHVQQYTKSKRKAPIYWFLQSANKSYGLWLYYPRMTRDTVYVTLRDYIEPKISHELEVLEGMRDALKNRRASREASQRAHAKQLEAQETLVQELRAFRDELRSVVEAGYDPDHNDGALINIAPFHRLVPWKDAAAAYKELKAGKYPWATLHQRYRFPK